MPGREDAALIYAYSDYFLKLDKTSEPTFADLSCAQFSGFENHSCFLKQTSSFNLNKRLWKTTPYNVTSGEAHILLSPPTTGFEEKRLTDGKIDYDFCPEEYPCIEQVAEFTRSAVGFSDLRYIDNLTKVTWMHASEADFEPPKDCQPAYLA